MIHPHRAAATPRAIGLDWESLVLNGVRICEGSIKVSSRRADHLPAWFAAVFYMFFFRTDLSMSDMAASIYGKSDFRGRKLRYMDCVEDTRKLYCAPSRQN